MRPCAMSFLKTVTGRVVSATHRTLAAGGLPGPPIKALAAAFRVYLDLEAWRDWSGGIEPTHISVTKINPPYPPDGRMSAQRHTANASPPPMPPSHSPCAENVLACGAAIRCLPGVRPGVCGAPSIDLPGRKLWRRPSWTNACGGLAGLLAGPPGHGDGSAPACCVPSTLTPIRAWLNPDPSVSSGGPSIVCLSPSPPKMEAGACGCAEATGSLCYPKRGEVAVGRSRFCYVRYAAH